MRRRLETGDPGPRGYGARGGPAAPARAETVPGLVAEARGPPAGLSREPKPVDSRPPTPIESPVDEAQTRPELLSDAPLHPERARLLLQKLRDLNLCAERIEVGPGTAVELLGCSSLDQPVEGGLRYRVRCGDGQQEALEFGLESAGLRLCRSSAGRPEEAQRILLVGNGSGPLTAPELKARIDPEQAGPREMTHFLRRLVRLAYGPN